MDRSSLRTCLPQSWQTLTAGMGLDAALADRPGSGFGIQSVCGNSMLTYVTYRQTLRPDGRPNPLITGGGTRTLALGHLPISALHDPSDLLCRLYLFPRAHTSFVTSLHGWLTSFSSLSDPVGPHYFSEQLNPQRSNVDPVTGELDK